MVADTTLGLGAGRSETEAKSRATGEVLERYGAAIVPPNVPERVQLLNDDGQPAGHAPPADIWLPFHRGGRPALPARSDGLAFSFDAAEARRSARAEAIERRALRQLGQAARPVGTELRSFSSPIPGGRAFSLPAPEPVVLVLLPDAAGRLRSAGACCAPLVEAAAEAALREALLGWLIAIGAVLPGSGISATELVGPLEGTPVGNWRDEPGRAEEQLGELAFVDITPGDLRRGQGHVVRSVAASPALA